MSPQEQDYTLPENWHEAAGLFPLMPDDELQKLADDIKANGLRNPIILLNDKILDGRNRLLACKIAGVPPDFQSRNPEKLGSPVAWVLSHNLHRRHLTPTQRAFIAVEAEKLFAVEARNRQATSLGGSNPQLRAKLPEAARGRARDQAAKALGVSPRYVSDAKKIAANSPETAEAVKAGKVSSVADAKKIAQLEKSNPQLAEAVRSGKIKLRDAKPAVKPKNLRDRYSEPDFFARIGRMLAATLMKPQLDELINIKKGDWTDEAADAFPRLIANLEEVSKRADKYAAELKDVLKRNGKAKKAA